LALQDILSLLAVVVHTPCRTPATTECGVLFHPAKPTRKVESIPAQPVRKKPHRLEGDDAVKILSIAFIGMALVMPGAVVAKDASHAAPPANADQYYGLYQNQSQAIGTFDHSGTIGRDGRGANPFHPDGPGNVVD
jgi:hypothetical protein